MTVEAGRGLAALAVVLFHAGGSIFPAPKYWHSDLFAQVFGWGYAGVFFFFALSGFIIAQVHVRDVGQRTRLRHYVGRRLARIYPVYWLVLAGLVALGAAGIGAVPTAGVLASSVLLAGPDNHATVVAVAWTLYHEIAFYAVFAAWIVSVRLGQIVTLAWLALIAATALFGASAVPAYLAAPVNLVFGLGVAAWRASRSPLPTWLAVAGAAGFAAVAVDTVTTRLLPEVGRELAFGATAALTIAAMVARERRRALAVPRLLLALGAASYSIYLTHFPILSMLAKVAVAARLVDRNPPVLGFVATVALTVLLRISMASGVPTPASETGR